jgi:glycosyltransferase involved in cell wall biosynthesis
MKFFDFDINVELKLDTVGLVLLSVLSVCLIIQLVYYWGFLAKPFRYWKKIENGKMTLSKATPPVSVIICARGETENIQAYLPSILEQNYPEYEVIVVNDDSNDTSENVLRQLKNVYKHLYCTYVPQGTRNLSRKKLGITLGIKAAQYDTLLFTEADSHPVGADWLTKMVRHFSGKKTIVLGFSAFEKQSGLRNKFAAYDYFFANLQMMTMALMHRSYGANSRNLAYHRIHFDAQKGYSKHRFLQSGEDDLFINEVATKENVAVELSPESKVYVKRDGLTEWHEFRASRAVTRQYYKKSGKFLWKMETWSRLFFYASLAPCLIYDFCNIVLYVSVILAFLIRFYTQSSVINQTAGSLKLEKYHFTLFFYDLIQPFVDLYYFIYRIFKGKRSYTWKFEIR